MLEIYLIILGVLIFGLALASSSYSTLLKTYYKYNTTAYVNLTAGQVVVATFNFLNLPDHRISVNPKPFSDAYVVSRKVVVLSEKNINSKTISAIAVAAHELGHVMQHKEGSSLFSITYLFQRLSRLADISFIPILLTSSYMILFSEENYNMGIGLLYLAGGLFILTMLFKLILIPLEMDASRRALRLLKDQRILDADELKGARKVLRAAALTYVGGLFYDLLRLLRGLGRGFK
jgi:Zn-dependent membrane protease YugP